MLKVLVVDDDRLVRKGILTAMPWADFGMAVVGEAGNGEKALEFLAANPVDILVTDLAMPVMSGVELMRIAHQRYPAMFLVVLTMHEDFEYVQEALRIGAIDYIAKHQLEKEQFEEVLGRIRHRIDAVVLDRSEGIEGRKNAQDAELEGIHDAVSFWFSHDESQEVDWAHRMTGRHAPVEIASANWVMFLSEGTEGDREFDGIRNQLERQPGWFLFRVSDVRGYGRETLYRVIRKYRQNNFFYNALDHVHVTELHAKDLERTYPQATREAAEMARKEWLSFEWMDQDSQYDRMLSELQVLHLPEERLKHLLIAVEEGWNRIYGEITGYVSDTIPSVDSWAGVEKWSKDLRRKAHLLTGRQRHSPEVIDCILRVVRIMQEEPGEPIHAVLMAKRVNMSRSHFCECFKEIVGQSFNLFLRRQRTDKARELLEQTNLSVLQISTRVGYLDEKYFSQVFRESTGLLPSEYRRNLKADGQRGGRMPSGR